MLNYTCNKKIIRLSEIHSCIQYFFLTPCSRKQVDAARTSRCNVESIFLDRRSLDMAYPNASYAARRDDSKGCLSRERVAGNGIGGVRMALGKLHFGYTQSDTRNNSASLF